MAHRPLSALRRLPGREDGASTILAIFLFLIAGVMGGLAVDFNNSMARRTAMENATQALAHAALYHRELESAHDSVTQAMSLIPEMLPPSRFGQAIYASDFEFGDWDPETETFTARDTSRDAVQVTAWANKQRDNAVSTILLKLAGWKSFDLARRTIYETYIPACFREGFVAEGEIDVTSGNTYKSYFCLHSNQFVEVNVSNTFEPNSIVSMPRLEDLVTPTDGFEKNDGLEAALREAGYKLRILDRLDAISQGVSDPDSPYYRSYITSAVPVAVDGKNKLDDTVFLPGRIYNISCHNGKASIHTDTVLKNVVIKTACKLDLGQGVALEDAVIISTNTAVNAVSSASGVRIGRDDHCASGGDAQIVTYGGVSFPADVQMYGGQIIAKDDVEFTANANGIEGASIVSGGRIYGTANSVMGFCNTKGMENNFVAKYFRMAQSAAASG